MRVTIIHTVPFEELFDRSIQPLMLHLGKQRDGDFPLPQCREEIPDISCLDLSCVMEKKASRLPLVSLRKCNQLPGSFQGE